MTEHPESLSPATLLTVFALAFLAFAPLTPSGFPNGDAAVYAQQIDALDFRSRSTHLGYYLLGALPAHLLPGWGDRALNLMSAAFAAATAAAVFAVTRQLGGGRPAAVFAALVLGANSLFLRHAVHAEVYVVETFFVVLAVALWLARRSFATGLALAAACLATPSALLAAPAFAVLRPRLRPIALAAAGGALLLVPALAWAGRDYFLGPRGLLGAAGAGFEPVAALAKEAFEVVTGFYTLLPCLLLGLWSLAEDRERRRFGAALAVLALVSFLLGERFDDVPVQLPTYALAAAVCGLGGERALRLAAELTPVRRAWLPGVLAAVAALPIAGLLVARSRSAPLRELPALFPALCAGVLVAAAIAATLVAVLGSSSESRRAPLPGSPALVPATPIAAGLLLSAALALLLVGAKNREIESYRRSVLAVAESAAPGYRVVAPWSHGILFEHYLERASYTERWLDPAWLGGFWGETKRLEAERAWRASLEAGREVYLVGELPRYTAELEAAGYVLEPLAVGGREGRGRIVRARPPAESGAVP